MNRERVIHTDQVPSISREEPESEAASSSRNSPVSNISEHLPFLILDETSKSFPNFNETGRSLLIKLRSPAEHVKRNVYLKECITALNNYLVNDVRDSDLVGLRIRNTDKVQYKLLGISFRRGEQLKPDVVCGVLGKVVQSNAWFGLCDRLEVNLDHVTIPIGNDREKTKGRSLNIVNAIKKIIVKVTAGFLFGSCPNYRYGQGKWGSQIQI